MSSLCNNCASPVDEGDVYCKHCGSKIDSSSNASILTKTGKESINIGVGNLPNANIHIGDKYEFTKKAEKPALIRRKTSRQIRLGNIMPKASWLTISGGLGILGSLASMVSAFTDIWSLGTSWLITPWFPCIIGVSLLLLVLGLVLQLRRLVSLSWTNLIVESSRDGHLFITKIGGTCPKCGGQLRLIDIGPENRKKTVVVCMRNPSQHRWTFDHTVLPDL